MIQNLASGKDHTLIVAKRSYLSECDYENAHEALFMLCRRNPSQTQNQVYDQTHLIEDSWN